MGSSARRAFCACLVVAACALAACDVSGTADPPAGPVGTPGRVVSLAPSITELVFALGAGERLVGVTSHCDHPAGARSLPRVGGYTEPNIELVLAARPDVVLVPAEGTLLGPTTRLRSLGLRVAPVTVTALPELFTACERLGALLGVPSRGAALAADLRGRFGEVRRRVRALQPRPTLVIVDHRPTVAAAPGTFVHGLLEAAGGANVLEGSPQRWPQLGSEAIIGLAPEVVVDVSMGADDEASREARARFWRRFPGVPAVRAGRVHALPPELLVRPGPRLVDGLEALARAIQPGAFEPPAGASSAVGAPR
jgi:iron complex transport system substrate-binding protein